MRLKPTILVTALIAIAAVACEGNREARPGDSSRVDLAFVDVTLVPMTDEGVVEHQTVLIRDETIIAIGPSDEAVPPDTAIVVSGQGRFLIPGLADMHVHATDESFLDLFVANGITLVRNMWGRPFDLQWRSEIEAGSRLGPRIVTAGAIVDGVPPIWDASVAVGDAESAIAEMDAQQAAGYDFLKIYERISPAVFAAIARHSRETGFPFAGHVPQAVPIDEAMRAGMRTIEHLTGWDEATARAGSDFASAFADRDRGAAAQRIIRIGRRLAGNEVGWDEIFDPDRRRSIAELAADTGVWSVPTLVVLQRVTTSRRQTVIRLAEPEMRYVSPAMRASWNPSNDFRLQAFSDDDLEARQVFLQESFARVRALHDAGAHLLAGSDTPNPWVVPGFSLHQELGLLVEAGLTPYEALVAATRAPAEFLGDDSFGTIEEGKRADLILLEANPLDDIAATREIAGVSIRNRWLPRSELDAMLERVADHVRSAPP
jgi:imidazolonepropionase-like amidohydrolase